MIIFFFRFAPSSIYDTFKYEVRSTCTVIISNIYCLSRVSVYSRYVPGTGTSTGYRMYKYLYIVYSKSTRVQVLIPYQYRYCTWYSTAYMLLITILGDWVLYNLFLQCFHFFIDTF